MFERVTTLTNLPGQCKLCGAADKEWYLDTGSYEQFYGAIYYCCECISEMLITTQQDSEVAKLGLKISLLNAVIEKLHADVKERDDALKFIINSEFTATLVGSAVNEVHSSRESPSEQKLGIGTGTFDEQGDDEGMEFVPTIKSGSSRKGKATFKL